MNGFLLVDKPPAWTSHDVVAKVRGLAGQRKIGHAGTLDPMATGLLVLGLGRATRLLRFVQESPKTYTATARFGVATDSLDADGAVLAREPMSCSEAEIRAVAQRFEGEIMQVPPMVSALKVGGRRLYDLARQGVDVERRPRAVTVQRLDITDVAPGDYPDVTFSVVCSTGTYVRTLADDMAAALGGRAHLTGLRRTAIGSLTVEGAATMDELVARADAGDLDAVVLGLADGLSDMPAVTLPAEAVAAAGNGMPFPLSALGSRTPTAGPVRLLDPDGRLVAVYRVERGRSRPEVVIG